MTHGFKNGRVIAEQGTVERVGVGEFLKFDDGTDNFQTFSSNGSPEGVIAADKGSVSHDISTGCLYTKTTDTVNTGWECLAAAGGVGGSGITFLASATASSSSEVVFTSDIDSTYNVYLLVWQDIKPQTDGAFFYLQTSTDGGATYDSGASDYDQSANFASNAPTAFVWLSSQTQGIGNATNEKTDGYMYLMNPSSTEYTSMIIEGINSSIAGNVNSNDNKAFRLSAADVDALRFYMNTGNIVSGTIKLYGLVTPA
jgi:hypothetical protein